MVPVEEEVIEEELSVFATKAANTSGGDDKQGFVEMPADFPGFERKIYVRLCYIAFLAWLMEQLKAGTGFRGCGLSDSPGIGKSVFLVWLLTK